MWPFQLNLLSITNLLQYIFISDLMQFLLLCALIDMAEDKWTNRHTERQTDNAKLIFLLSRDGRVGGGGGDGRGVTNLYHCSLPAIPECCFSH